MCKELVKDWLILSIVFFFLRFRRFIAENPLEPRVIMCVLLIYKRLAWKREGVVKGYLAYIVI